MALDFQLKVKMGVRDTPQRQESCNTTALNKRTSIFLFTTFITCGAVSIQLIPDLNKTWDKIMNPWQSFLESQLGKPGNAKRVVGTSTTANPTVSIADNQLISDASLVPGDSVAGYPVTSGYGVRISPCSGCSSSHEAIDVGMSIGTPLYAPFDTTVECPNYGGLAGLVAEFPSQENKYTVQLLHLHDCTPGEAKKGQKIAESGTAGTGPHLDLRLKDENGDRPIPSKKLLEKVLRP